MPKTKKKPQQINTMTLWAVIAVLAVLCIGLLIALHNKDTNNKSSDMQASISLGSLQYSIANGKAAKRTDPSVTALRNFLTTEAAQAGCSAQAPAYEHVIAASSDEMQVMLKYGCGAADSPMYAVKANSTWQALSPTDHFDTFDVPDCAYVAQNHLDKEVAPVCANGVQNGVPTATPAYTVR